MRTVKKEANPEVKLNKLKTHNFIFIDRLVLMDIKEMRRTIGRYCRSSKKESKRTCNLKTGMNKI